MCIFVNTLRPEVTLRVWDMFLNEGNKVLFRIAAALFKLNEAKLMAVRDAGDLFNTLRSIGSDITDPEILIATAYKNYIPSNSKGAMKNILRSRGSSSPAVTMRKATTDNISPRLHPMTPNGAVPKDLLGLGLAHLGPADAYEKYRAGSKSVDVVKLPSSPSPSMKLMTPGNNPSLSSSSSFSMSTSSSLHTSDSITAGNSSIGSQITSDIPPPPLLATSGENSPTPHSDKHDQESVAESVDQFDPTFADPSLLFRNIGELGTGTESGVGSGVTSSSGSGRHLFVANNNSAAHKKKMERRQKKVRSGQYFAFYRADIALWRSSFRPGLEERYQKMEMARNNWKKKNSISSLRESSSGTGVNGNGGSTSIAVNDEISEKFTPLVIAEDEKNVKGVSIRPGVIRDLDEEEEERSNNNSATHSPISPSQRGSSSGGAGGVVRRPSLKDFIRRSFDAGDEGGNTPDDVLDVSDLNYNIDHAFVNTAAADELTKVKPTPTVVGVAGTIGSAAISATISRTSVSSTTNT
jgi:hypothetical protein